MVKTIKLREFQLADVKSSTSPRGCGGKLTPKILASCFHVTFKRIQKGRGRFIKYDWCITTMTKNNVVKLGCLQVQLKDFKELYYGTTGKQNTERSFC